jgi:hypothetical protein
MRQVKQGHRCPKRERQRRGVEDTWNELDGERICSFCGSLHPQDFMYFLSSVLDTRSSYWIHVNQRRGERTKYEGQRVDLSVDTGFL